MKTVNNQIIDLQKLINEIKIIKNNHKFCPPLLPSCHFLINPIVGGDHKDINIRSPQQ